MLQLIGAALFFIAIHLCVAGTAMRGWLVQRLGEKVYLALFALASLAGLIWLIQAYRHAPLQDLWGQITALRWLASVFMVPACVFLVLGMITPNPTAVGGEALILKGVAAHGIYRITRHPFLVGTGLWSAVHVVYNGDVAAAIFFGTFLVLSVMGPPSIDYKQRQALGDNWQQFGAHTSIVPFLAILQGRNHLQLAEIGWWRPVLGLVLYSGLAFFHQKLFGVALFVG